MLDAPVDAMVRGLIGADPALQESQVAEGFHRSLERVWSMVCSAVASGLRADPRVFALMGLIGTELARRDVPPGSVEECVRAAMRPAWRLILAPAGVQRRRIAPEAVAPAASRCRELEEALVAAAAAGYESEAGHPIIENARARDDFVESLLSGVLEPDRLAAEGHALADHYGLLIAVPRDGDGPVRTSLRKVAHRILPDTSGIFVGRVKSKPCDHVALLVPAVSDVWPETFLATVEGVAAAEGVAVVLERPRSLRKAVNLYRTVQPHLGVVISATLPVRIVAPSTVLILGLLSSIPAETRLTFLRETLGPLTRWPSGRRRKTITTLELLYHWGGGIEATSQRLRVHKNTVRYRLNTIQTALEVDLDAPADRLLIELAMRLRALGASLT